MTDKQVRFVLTADDRSSAAFKKVSSQLQDMQASSAGLAARFGTLGTAVVAAFGGASLVGAVDVLDQLDDLAEKSGIAVDSLAALRFAGEAVGTPIEELAKGIRKLSVNLADAQGGGKESAATFAAIGVSITDAAGKLRGTDDILLDIADAFASWEDGATKTADAVAIFGKSGEALIPLLNQGRAGIQAQREEAQRLGVVYSKDLAKAGADFNDNLRKITFSVEAQKAIIAEAVLPTLNDLAKQFLSTRDAGEQFSLIGETIRTVLETVAVLGANVKFVLVGIGRDLGGMAAQLAALSRLDFSGFAAIGEALREDAQKAREELDAYERRVLSVKSVSQALTSGDFARGDRAPGKRQAPVIDKQGEARDTELASLLDRIAKRVTASRQELELGRQLTEAERFQIDIETALTSTKSKLTDRQREYVRAQAAEAAGVDDTLRRQQEQIKAAGQISALTLRQLDDLQKTAEARTKDNQVLRDSLDEIGKTVREVEALRQKRVEEALALEELNLLQLKNADASAAEVLATERVVEALRQKLELQGKITTALNREEDDPLRGAQRAVKAYLDDIAKAGVSTERAITSVIGTLEDELTSVFSGKGFDAKRLVDQIIAEFTRLAIVKPLLDSIFKSGGFGSFLALFSGGGGNIPAGSTVPPPTALAGGMDYVPFDNFPALLHKGERVVPAADNGRWGGGGINIHVNVPGGTDRSSANQLAATIAQRLAIAQSRNG